MSLALLAVLCAIPPNIEVIPGKVLYELHTDKMDVICTDKALLVQHCGYGLTPTGENLSVTYDKTGRRVKVRGRLLFYGLDQEKHVQSDPYTYWQHLAAFKWAEDAYVNTPVGSIEEARAYEIKAHLEEVWLEFSGEETPHPAQQPLPAPPPPQQR